jgi:uncharacterized protein (DUF2252 family)
MPRANLSLLPKDDMGSKIVLWEKRHAAGKDLRRSVSRESHAEWIPPKDRPNPLELIAGNNKGRSPILTRVSASIKAKVIDALNRYSSTLPRERGLMLRRYHVADVAHRVVGVVSVGTRAYLALLFGSGDSDPLFLQVKEAAPPAHAPYLPQLAKEFRHNGKQVVLGQKGLQASNDPMLGYTEIDGRHYYVRQMKNLKASIPVEWLTGGPITSLHGRAHTRGWETQRRSPATAASQRSWIRRWRNGPRVTEIRRSRTTQCWLSPSNEERLKHTSKR